MKSFKKSLKSMIFILLGPWPEKRSGGESSGKALGELWEISGKDVPPEMFIQRIWDTLWESSWRALGEVLESSGRALGER